MSTKFIKKLNMTWLDDANEQHRSLNMNIRSPGVGGRDLWCVKGAKNGYEMIQSLIAYPFSKIAELIYDKRNLKWL